MSYQIEYRHLKYFLAVAEHLHFRKAAESLYISQPGLSRQIKEMEESLGVKLFERHNRNVKLTTVGLYLKLELSKNLKSLDAILHHAKLLEDGKDGQLNFGYVGSAMQKIIPELLLNFTKTHPNILFSLKEMDNNKQIEGLLAQDIDIGFVRLEKVHKGLELHPILKEPFCLVLPKNHPIDASNFKTISQFKEEHFILFDPEYSASYYEKVMDIFNDNGFSPLVSHNTIHAGSIYKLVENNFGISIVPKSLKTENNANIKFIELTKIPQRTTLSAIWNKDNQNPILSKVLSIIQKENIK
ncbi:DNA-binding transcriptional LysR family regulator [Mariniflexile fucanivorans]|uniref:DNA-binding transcriptional LysR family regulator n=1 Tax=Mariniflexile fucanivorans TaxID=264023 RepID=A0A4R1RF52_9FLAO|nr:LysR family transcriptional regulator [Mariniflexile fucanivorans]TCL64499.1 DNA-binding transcriptional LysR family regulator [Mariniflexile fucanivorans]